MTQHSLPAPSWQLCLIWNNLRNTSKLPVRTILAACAHCSYVKPVEVSCIELMIQCSSSPEAASTHAIARRESAASQPTKKKKRKRNLHNMPVTLISKVGSRSIWRLYLPFVFASAFGCTVLSLMHKNQVLEIRSRCRSSSRGSFGQWIFFWLLSFFSLRRKQSETKCINKFLKQVTYCIHYQWERGIEGWVAGQRTQPSMCGKPDQAGLTVDIKMFDENIAELRHPFWMALWYPAIIAFIITLKMTLYFFIEV